MKRTICLIGLSLTLSLTVRAQLVNDTLRFAESIWSMKKKAMILEEMDLTEAQKSSFWPVYESYSNAVQYLDMEYIQLLRLAGDERRSEKKVEFLTESLLLNELQLAKTRKYYYRRFKKALNPTLAGKFMRIDNDFRTMIRLQMQRPVPGMITSLGRSPVSN